MGKESIPMRDDLLMKGLRYRKMFMLIIAALLLCVAFCIEYAGNECKLFPCEFIHALCKSSCAHKFFYDMCVAIASALIMIVFVENYIGNIKSELDQTGFFRNIFGKNISDIIVDHVREVIGSDAIRRKKSTWEFKLTENRDVGGVVTGFSMRQTIISLIENGSSNVAELDVPKLGGSSKDQVGIKQYSLRRGDSVDVFEVRDDKLVNKKDGGSIDGDHYSMIAKTSYDERLTAEGEYKIGECHVNHYTKYCVDEVVININFPAEYKIEPIFHFSATVNTVNYPDKYKDKLIHEVEYKICPVLPSQGFEFRLKKEQIHPNA